MAETTQAAGGAVATVRKPRRSSAVRVVCLECGKRWSTSNPLPECSGCGGVDVEPA